MKINAVGLLLCALLLGACSQLVTTSIRKQYPVLHYRDDVKVFALTDPFPENAEIIGVVTIDDTGFTTNCGWEVVLDKAKLEARKIGGNAVKITKHSLPNFFGSSCHRIVAAILKTDSCPSAPAYQSVDSAMLKAGYALLYVYGKAPAGALFNYDLHMGDSIICGVDHHCKQTFKLTQEGINTFWARSEVKREVPVDIRFGHRYYLRCGVGMGAFVGRPQLELVDNQTGEAEYRSVQTTPSAPND